MNKNQKSLGEREGVRQSQDPWASGVGEKGDQLQYACLRRDPQSPFLAHGRHQCVQ